MIDRAVSVNDGEVVESFFNPAHTNDVASCENHPRSFFCDTQGLRKCSAAAAQRANSHHKRDKLSAEQLHSVAQEAAKQSATVASASPRVGNASGVCSVCVTRCAGGGNVGRTAAAIVDDCDHSRIDRGCACR